MNRSLVTFFTLAHLAFLGSASLHANLQNVDTRADPPSKQWFGLGTLPQPSWIGETTRVEHAFDKVWNYFLNGELSSSDFIVAYTGGDWGLDPYLPPKPISLVDKSWLIDSSAAVTIGLTGFPNTYTANDGNKLTGSSADQFDRQNSRFAEVVSSDGVVLARSESHGHIDSLIDDDSFSIYGELFTSGTVNPIVKNSNLDGSVITEFEAEYLVTRPVEIAIDGTLASIGSSHAAFELVSLDTNETLFSLDASRGVENSISVSTTLEPGEYRFSIDATGEGGRFAGRSDAQFDFEFTAFELDPQTESDLNGICSLNDNWDSNSWDDDAEFSFDRSDSVRISANTVDYFQGSLETVPEPASSVLTIVGFGVLVGFRRKYRSVLTWFRTNDDKSENTTRGDSRAFPRGSISSASTFLG